MRTAVIAGNWKLFKTIKEATDMVKQLKPLVSKTGALEIVIAPVFTALSAVAGEITGTNIRLSAQDCYWEEEGAFTGEVAPAMLKEAGCSYVIIGHSERRQYFSETDEMVNRKIKAAIAAGLTAILCIGETLNEREADKTFTVIEFQLTKALADVDASKLKNMIIAYEPVWAIGTGKTASNSQAVEVHQFIRTLVAKIYNKADADKIRIIYGGSVKPDNISALMAESDIDGALVGGASLTADSFAAIVNYKQ